MRTYIKDPDATLDYGFRFGDWLETGETITASTWSVPSGITKESDNFADDQTIIWLSGGTVDETYTLTNSIETSSGRIDDRSLRIKIKNR
jgi:hypothetical protein